MDYQRGDVKMTDERYAFVEDVKNRKNVAKSGGKKGKSRYGCALPVDYMTTKEKRDANSRWISVTYDRPISFDKFLAYSDDDKKKYLQTLIDRYSGDTGKIAKMFGCTEAKIKVFRQNLGVVYNIEWQRDEIMWDTFLMFDEFLRKPMSYDNFKTLDWYDQSYYMNFLTEKLGAGINRISSELFYCAQSTLEQYLNRNKISYYRKERGYRMLDEKLKQWEEWLGKNDEPEQKTEETYIPKDTSNEEIHTVEEPDETKSYVVPSMQAHFRIDSQDQIIEMLSKLPKARKGQIFFIWGKED